MMKLAAMVLKKILPLFLGAVCVLCIDFLTKAYVHDHIPLMSYSSAFYPYGGIPVFKDWHGIGFSINHVTNLGAAWGILASFQESLLYLRIGVIASLFSYLVFFNRSLSKAVALTLIVSGALGNVIDFFRFGHVVDMFHFTFGNYTFPIFNIADSAIFCGVAWLLLYPLFTRKSTNVTTATEI